MCVYPFLPVSPFDEPFRLQDCEFCICRLYMPSSRSFHIAFSGATPTILSLKLVRALLHCAHGLTSCPAAVYEVRGQSVTFIVALLSAPQRQSH